MEKNENGERCALAVCVFLLTYFMPGTQVDDEESIDDKKKYSKVWNP